MRLLPFLGALFAIYLLFDRLATALGSNRGQAGLVVCGVVVAATLAAQAWIFRQRPVEAARWLGLGRPVARGVLVAVGISALLLLVIPLFARVRGVPVVPLWDGFRHVPGLFAQAGIAEETLFRGYLFHNLRATHSFWRATGLALVPFAAVHLVLFATMSWPVALAALLLALAVTPPMAKLFELGGNTIWAPAILHFVIQGAIKLVELPGAAPLFPIVWMAAAATIPWLAFVRFDRR